MRLKMDEDLEKSVIETLPIVTWLCFHTTQNKNKSEYRANLRCVCGVQQVGSEGPIHISSNYPRFLDCLRELRQNIQRDHGPTCVTASQELFTREIV